jgi:cell division protein ZapA (FtsZ GTPase activity inhibitor)
MEEAQELNSITVIVAGRPLPLRVKPEDEGSIRKLVKEINEKVNRFQITYPQKDKQDCLSMTLLTYAVELHKLQQGAVAHEVLSPKLSQLESLIDEEIG